MPRKRSGFHPRTHAMKILFWPALIILIVMAVTVRLGFWQRDRAHQKEHLNAQMVAFESAPAQKVGAKPMSLKEVEFHRVMARGAFMADQGVHLDNRPY